MIRPRLAVVVAAGLLLAGCSSTVAGTPVADPSGVPRPDTGSYATQPRTVDPMTERVQAAAEGFRMMATMPLAPDVDPSLRYGKAPHVGLLGSGVKLLFGDGVAAALDGNEVGATTGATSKAPGADPSARGTEILPGLFRFKDEAAARAAVSNPAVLQPDTSAGGDAATKKPVTVPGYAEAKAYTRTVGSSTSSVALLPVGRFVAAFWTNGSLDLAKKYFDLQVKALDGFVPTPVDKFSTLTRDHDDLLRYTLAEEKPTVFQATLPPRIIAAFSTDVTAAVKVFADAGVDYIANAGNTVYRAKDSAGAKLLAEQSIADQRGFRAGATEATVKGVPGGRCLTYPSYSGSKDTKTYCVVPVGRYLAEVQDTQQTRAYQAIGASYVILRSAK